MPNSNEQMQRSEAYHAARTNLRLVPALEDSPPPRPMAEVPATSASADDAKQGGSGLVVVTNRRTGGRWWRQRKRTPLAAAANTPSAAAAANTLSAAAADTPSAAAAKGVLAAAAKGVRFRCRHHRPPVDSLQQRDQNLLVWHHQRWPRWPAPLPSAEVAVSIPRQGSAAGLSGLFGRPQISTSVH